MSVACSFGWSYPLPPTILRRYPALPPNGWLLVTGATAVLTLHAPADFPTPLFARLSGTPTRLQLQPRPDDCWSVNFTLDDASVRQALRGLPPAIQLEA